jgi:hypothetical protein
MMTIPTIDRETYTFRYWSGSSPMNLVSVLLIPGMVTTAMIFGIRGWEKEAHGITGSGISIQNPFIYGSLLGLVLISVRVFNALNRRKIRIEVQGDQIRYFTGKETTSIEQSLRNVETLTIRIKGGAIGIASWRRIDFKDGQSIIFDGQVDHVEMLEDLLTERSGKQFLRWLTGEAYQKPQ